MKKRKSFRVIRNGRKKKVASPKNLLIEKNRNLFAVEKMLNQKLKTVVRHFAALLPLQVRNGLEAVTSVMYTLYTCISLVQ